MYKFKVLKIKLSFLFTRSLDLFKLYLEKNKWFANFQIPNIFTWVNIPQAVNILTTPHSKINKVHKNLLNMWLQVTFNYFFPFIIHNSLDGWLHLNVGKHSKMLPQLLFFTCLAVCLSPKQNGLVVVTFTISKK